MKHTIMMITRLGILISLFLSVLEFFFFFAFLKYIVNIFETENELVLLSNYL